MSERVTRIRASQIRSILPSDVDSTNALGAGVDGYVPSYNDSESKFTWVDVSSLVTLQNAFDNGRSITIADGDNQALLITNNDTTNNPKVLGIQNEGTGRAVEIDQNGNGIGLTVLNSGTNNGIYVQQDGVMSSSNHALHVSSGTAQTTESLVYFRNYASGTTQPVLEVVQDHASSTANVMTIDNDGTGYGLYIQQDGVNSSSNALRIISDAIQTGSDLVVFKQDNASTTRIVLNVIQDGSGGGIQVDNNGSGEGVVVIQSAENASNDSALKVYSVVQQTNSPLVYLSQNNASTTQPVLEVVQDHASSTANVIEIQQDGTGDGLYIDVNGDGGYAILVDHSSSNDGIQVSLLGELDASSAGMKVYSNSIAQTNTVGLFQVFSGHADTTSSLIFAKQEHNSSIAKIIDLIQDGNGTAVEIENNGTGHGLYIQQDGVLASQKRALYVYSNAVQTVAFNFIHLDNASSTAGTLALQNDGSGYGLNVYTVTGTGINIISDSKAHLNLSGDPTNAVPTDGDFWFDGTDLKVHVGSTTYTLDKTSV